MDEKLKRLAWYQEENLRVQRHYVNIFEVAET